MFKYALYGLFGLVVVSAYGVTAVASRKGHVYGTRGTVVSAPPSSDPTTYRATPIIWGTGFHGPAARVIDYTPRRTSYGGSGYGGSGRGYGGYGGK